MLQTRHPALPGHPTLHRCTPTPPHALDSAKNRGITASPHCLAMQQSSSAAFNPGALSPNPLSAAFSPPLGCSAMGGWVPLISKPQGTILNGVLGVVQLPVWEGMGGICARTREQRCHIEGPHHPPSAGAVSDGAPSPSTHPWGPIWDANTSCCPISRVILVSTALTSVPKRAGTHSHQTEGQQQPPCVPGWKNPEPGVGTQHLPRALCKQRLTQLQGSGMTAGENSAQARRAAMCRAAPMGDPCRSDGSDAQWGLGGRYLCVGERRAVREILQCHQPQNLRIAGDLSPAGAVARPHQSSPSAPLHHQRREASDASMQSLFGFSWDENGAVGPPSSPPPTTVMLQVTATPHSPGTAWGLNPIKAAARPRSSPHAGHRDEAVPHLGSHAMGTEPQIPPLL